ncbi:hypothetical protein QBC34DRAFT_449031 [Podospora aff. communis PSN243]|uniref:Centrosomin N-terminal motif 1 domain-containing protein n=1 Tax=Podospora aff. communis PSN243 TaxID=3040156 RepID=A0AAV9GNY1_9PEZI|nr:hypothetical protein QBC34DRAFT_449031 [Podospora aff. communis PSN243]
MRVTPEPKGLNSAATVPESSSVARASLASPPPTRTFASWFGRHSVLSIQPSHQARTLAAPAQRHPYSRTARPPAPDRPRSQLSREASEHSRESLPTMSSYLQEKLERERRANESERSSSRASTDAFGMSVDHRAVQSSPARNNTSDRRPTSSGTGAAPVVQEALGLKAMEQELSRLQKQNWNLKLELFHRREKQTALEARVEELEKEKEERDEMNDRLVQEMEKRDKAVEEAVEMIVTLEARVEQLHREREMVRRIEHDRYYGGDSPSPEMTPKRKMPPFDDPKVLNRMPSFLSDFSENTANLRNVYLGVRGSVLSLPRMADDGHDAERMEHNGVSSPTLSVLSESSFVSVYGQKKTDETSQPADDSVSSVDGPGRDRGASVSESVKASTPSKPRRSSASRSPFSLGQFQNIHRVLDMTGSPLQRLERLEQALNAMGEASRPPTSNQEKSPVHPAQQAQPAPTQRKTKQEKREALERVITGHLARDHSHGLPPTPDTISTSTLRRFKNSNDTLSQEQSLVNERSYLALSETTASQVSDVDGDRKAQAASTTAFDGRRTLPLDGTARPFSTSPLPRPRSAGETTISRQQDREGWESDASDGGYGDDADSMASGFDPWLRESLKPDHPGALRPANSASQAGPGKQPGRISPDLFSFPTNSSGWAADAMYGSLGGTGYIGSMGAMGPGMPPPMADALDALGDSLPTPTPFFSSGLATPVVGAGSAPPPPPNRRSSLHAQTGVTFSSGSNPASPARASPMSSKVKRSPVRSDRTRSNSIDLRPASSNLRDIGLRQDRAMTVPPKQIHLPPPVAPEAPPQQSLPKQRHYPPTASQPPRSRGLNNLFRRSTGSAEPPQIAPSSAPPTETTFKNLPTPMMGLPSWGRRSSLVDDDRESATPPPILRNKPQPRFDYDEGGGVPLEPHSGGGNGGNGPPGTNGGAPTGNAPAPAVPRNEGGKRKWLGLGRVSSLRNRGV